MGDQLVAGFAHSGRYFAIERTQGFLSQLSKEHSYQQTGAVDDAELSRLGKQFGVHYVCVANVDSLFGDYFISTRLINVETAEIANSHNEEGAKLSNSADVISITQKIASILSDMTILEQQCVFRFSAVFAILQLQVYLNKTRRIPYENRHYRLRHHCQYRPHPRLHGQPQG